MTIPLATEPPVPDTGSTWKYMKDEDREILREIKRETLREREKKKHTETETGREMANEPKMVEPSRKRWDHPRQQLAFRKALFGVWAPKAYKQPSLPPQWDFN